MAKGNGKPRKSAQNTPEAPITELQESQTADKPKTRAPNWLPEEDEQLSKSWILVSTDPIKGNSQPRHEFWESVLADFNKYSPGPPRSPWDSLMHRWGHLQKAALQFQAIYEQLKANPASGSTPDDWVQEAKQRYFQQEDRQFAFERAWRFLKSCPKFNTMAQGKAKNGKPNKSTDVIQPPIQALESLEPGSTGGNPPDSQSASNWQRPTGVKAAKRQMEQQEYMAKKMKLMEKSSEDGIKRTAEAQKANDIQQKLVDADIKKLEMAIMMKKIDDCPDEASREYLAQQKSDILAKMKAEKAEKEEKAAKARRNQPKKQPSIDPSLDAYSAPASSAPFSSRPPTSEADQNVIEVENDSDDEDHEEDFDPTQTQDQSDLPINPLLEFL